MNKIHAGEFALPNGWVIARLEDLVTDPKSDIVDGPFGSNLKASEYINEGAPIIRLQNVKSNRFLDKNIRFISADKALELDRHNFQAGDIVITKLGDPLGEACVVPSHLEKGVIVADIVRARIDEMMLNKMFIIYAINSESCQNQFKKATKGTTRPRVNLSHIRQLQIHLAPRDEQDRIVNEIEKQFTRLDAGISALKRIQTNLKLYRASVLQSAFKGRFIKNRKGSGFSGALPTKQIQEIADVTTGATPQKSNASYWTNGKVPWVTSGELNKLHIEKPTNYITEKALDETNCKVFPKETLLIAMYGEGKTRGKCSELLIEAATNQAIAAIILKKSYKESKKFIKWFLVKNYVDMRKLSTGGVQPNLNLSKVKTARLPFPSVVEQQETVLEIERRFSMIEELETLIDHSLKRSERLRQSILKQAFQGKLVFQDPNNEPADELLKRIKSQREKKTIEKKLKKASAFKRRAAMKHKDKKRKSIYEITLAAGKSMQVETLFSDSGFNEDNIDDFYEELKVEIDKGRLKEIRKSSNKVLIGVAS